MDKKTLTWIIAFLLFIGFMQGTLAYSITWQDLFEDSVFNNTLWEATGNGVGACTGSWCIATSLETSEYGRLCTRTNKPNCGPNGYTTFWQGEDLETTIEKGVAHNWTFNVSGYYNIAGADCGSKSAVDYVGIIQWNGVTVGTGTAVYHTLSSKSSGSGTWGKYIVNMFYNGSDNGVAGNNKTYIFIGGVWQATLDTSSYANVTPIFKSTSATNGGACDVYSSIYIYDAYGDNEVVQDPLITANETTPSYANVDKWRNVTYKVNVSYGGAISNVNVMFINSTGDVFLNDSNATYMGNDVWASSAWFNISGKYEINTTVLTEDSTTATDYWTKTISDIDFVQYTSSPLEGHNSTFAVGLKVNATEGYLVRNGTSYPMSLNYNNGTFTIFNVSIPIKLVDVDGQIVSHYYNYSEAAGWNQTGTYDETIPYAFWPDISNASIPYSGVERQPINAVFNFTNTSEGTTVGDFKFVVNTTVYTANWSSNPDSQTQKYIAGFNLPDVGDDPTNLNIAAWVNLSYAGESVIRTSNETIKINKISLFICEDPANTTAYNFFIKDEDDQTSLNNTFEAIFDILDSNNEVLLQLNVSEAGYNNYSVCLRANETSFNTFAYIKYKTYYGFTHSYYLINNTISNQTQNFTLYNFNDTVGKSDLKITVRNKNNYQYYESIIGKLQRRYIGENVWRTVQMDKTGDYGLLFYNILEESTDYRIIFVDTQGNILDTTNSMKFVCTAGVCELTYLLTPLSEAGSSDNLTVRVEYDNLTGNVSVIFHDPTGRSSVVNSLVTKETMSGTLQICNLTSTGSSGTQYCDTSGHTGTIKVSVRTLTSGYIEGKLTKWIDAQPTKLVYLIGGAEGALWAFLICLVIVTAGSFSPVAGIISLIFALVAVYSLGIMTAITMTALTIAMVIGVVISFKVRS